jgi:hypothetical protein
MATRNILPQRNRKVMGNPESDFLTFRNCIALKTGEIFQAALAMNLSFAAKT